jgi:hypothetical protein
VGCLLVFSVTVGLAVPATAAAEESEQNRPGSEESRQENPRAMERYAAGFRFGLSDGRNEVDFKKYEFFFYWYPPLAWYHKSGWILATRLDFTGAALYSSGTTGFLGSIGPSVAVRKRGWPVTIDGGVSLAFLSEDRYGVEDLSGHLQFLSHAGITLLLIRNLGIGYEFQHVSNASIQEPNPGLNAHNFKISYRFW